MFDGGSDAFINQLVCLICGPQVVPKIVPSRLELVHDFGVVNVSWSHGTVERMNRDVAKTRNTVGSGRTMSPPKCK